MHQATHRVDKRTGDPICTLLPPCTPQTTATLNTISAFERFRAMQNISPEHNALALLMHIPTSEQPLPADYPDALISEASLLSKHLANKPELQLLHIYGDASLLSAEQLQQLFSVLRQHWQLPTNNFAWFSIEVQPGTSSWAALGLLRDTGFNRITLHCDARRIQATENLYEAARTLQYNTITIALTAPAEGAHDTSMHPLQSITHLQPDRILLQGADTAPSDWCKHLLHAGYVQTVGDNFVLSDDELLEHTCHSHTGNSCNRHLPVLGLGAGASSQLADLYYCNDEDLASYMQALAHKQLPPARGHRQIA